MTEQKPKPCPFCGCSETYIGRDVGAGCEAVYVVCRQCSTNGPWCSTERKARNAWNRRKESSL